MKKTENFAERFMTATGKFFDFIIPLCAFYFIGIVLNGVIVGKIFTCDITQVPIWSTEGITFASIAGLSALLAKKVYKWIKE